MFVITLIILIATIVFNYGINKITNAACVLCVKHMTMTNINININRGLIEEVSLNIGPVHKKMNFFWLLQKEANFG